MRFFFVRDYQDKYRYFSAEPPTQIQVKFSHLQKIWELAKKKLMLLPQNKLRQEQAFRRALNLEEKKLNIVYSGRLNEKKAKTRFRFFLRKQKTAHIFILIGEALLLPISGLAALLPGPNVFFGILALLLITHWQALRGINRILKKEYMFIPSPLLASWEEAVKLKQEKNFPELLQKIEEEFNLSGIQKILWK